MVLDVAAGQLKRMLILAFNNPERTEPLPFQYQLMLNPSEVSKSFGIEYTKPESQGSDNELVYNRTKQEDFSCSFMVDGTGTTGIPMDVTANLELFHRVCQKTNKANHRPNYLKIVFGDQIINCLFKSAEISYTLFHPTGLPLRATVSATFLRHDDKKTLLQQLNLQSPDLSVVRVVKEGDTLPGMSRQEYGDQKYYIDVARFNNLTNFRDLKPGDRILFPPLV